MVRKSLMSLAHVSILTLFLASAVFSQTSSPEWDKVVEAAKKEGRVVVSIPTSAELRKESCTRKAPLCYCVFHTKAATDFTRILPPISGQGCH